MIAGLNPVLECAFFPPKKKISSEVEDAGSLRSPSAVATAYNLIETS